MSIEALKPLPTNIISDYLKHILPVISKETNTEITIAKQEGTNVCVFRTNKGSEVLKIINIKMLSAFDTFIENELNELASHYNRSLIFFESEITDNTLFIRWI
ncbi:MAG: hypothetical protein DRG78_15805 [Epsilonproteobacteria bacterium]|nr:MAG: hypothetical protein DRG78_15805 [Campylobacterota bacterium]